MNAQYLAMAEPDEEGSEGEANRNTPSPASIMVPEANDSTHESASTNSSPGPAAAAGTNTRIKDEDERSNNSPSLLIDAFLRKDDHSSMSYNNQLDAFTSASQTIAGNNDSNDNSVIDACMAISLPSPRSMLNST